MILTEADAWADATGLPRPDNHDPRRDLGLGTAVGDQWIPGEVCADCHEPLVAGESYAVVRDEIVCIPCAAMARDPD